MNIRKIGFNLISKINRTPVKQFISEFSLSEQEKLALVKGRLKDILDIARTHTLFYSNYQDFYDFPVISKATLREEYNSFLSDKIDKNETITTNTSGSTGQPMTFYLSKNKKYRQNAEIIYFNNWGNIDVGDFHAYVKVTNLKSKLKLLIQNELLMNPQKLTNEWLDQQVNILKGKKITGIIGVPSAISAIAHRARERTMNEKDFKIKGIICSGETLGKKDIELMENTFGVKPISRYSTEEFGVLATSCPECGKFHVNDTGYVIEILRIDDDNHVEVGEEGRVVVTDLFSDYMPLIRFDTGDIAIYNGRSNCSFYPTGISLENILGRQVETIYDINEQPLSAFNINAATRDLHTVKQFQFVQDTLEVSYLYLVVTDNFSDTDKKLIENRIIGFLGVKPKIIIVDEIKALKSGKRPYVISNYNK